VIDRDIADLYADYIADENSDSNPADNEMAKIGLLRPAGLASGNSAGGPGQLLFGGRGALGIPGSPVAEGGEGVQLPSPHSVLWGL